MTVMKAGDSATFHRTSTPTATRTMLNRNGSRQPQARNEASCMWLTSAKVRDASNNPAGAPACGSAPKSTRRAFGACSTAISTAPPHSPPRAKPCSSRKVTRIAAAQRPIVLYAGADEHRRNSHEEQTDHKRRLASEAVAEVAEHDAART